MDWLGQSKDEEQRANSKELKAKGATLLLLSLWKTVKSQFLQLLSLS
jgi:hypothetical protein